MKKRNCILYVLLSLAVVLPVHSQTQGAPAASFVTTQVQLRGLVANPATLTVASLQKGKVVEGKNFKVTNHTGQVRKTFDYKGVRLKDLLDEANIQMPNPKERGSYYVLVTASDNYQVLFSWNELYSSPIGEQVYLIFEENGREIAEDGKFVLISAADKITGPRHVRWVKTIEVGKLQATP